MTIGLDNPSLDVPFVPTPETIVDEMLKFGRVCSTDLLYDLGCGDGRIVVTAAERFGTHGIGVDIDPDRVADSRAYAVRKRVSHLTTFREESLFETDFSLASIVTLYLLPGVNKKLRPRLLDKLRPGTRVVSHRFDMGDWEPDSTARIHGHSLYLWIIPANLDGPWQCTLRSGSSKKDFVVHFSQAFQKARGTVRKGRLEGQIQDARINGDALRFEVHGRMLGESVPLTFEGRVAENLIEGLFKRNGDASQGEPWIANRYPFSRIPLDRPNASGSGHTMRQIEAGPAKTLISCNPAK